MNEMDVIGFSKFDNPYSLAFLSNSLLWAEKAAASASVTEFWEYKYRIFKDGDGIVGANFGTFAALVAFFFHNLRDREVNRFARVNARFQEKMGVRFFNIAVQKLNRCVAI
jgi:hypothetical protein